MTECAPWDWVLPTERLKIVRGWNKVERRRRLESPEALWNIYSPFKGLAPSLRVSTTNPPVSMHGLAVDYDSRSTLDEVKAHIAEMAEAFRPQFLERTLSQKWRTVHVFEKPLLLMSCEHAETVAKTIVGKFKLDTLLAGYDEASTRPAQMWSNGGEWFTLEATPLSAQITNGLAVEAGKCSRLFGASEIPLGVLAEEVEKRFPGRWQGEFKLDAGGVRFWDPAADCPAGCQVKPDGMLCFTGKQAFVKWSEIFGSDWCTQQRTLNLGKAAESFIFDGKSYWKVTGTGCWLNLSRPDTILALKNCGLSDKTPKGSTVSDCERVLHYIQEQNRVEGAVPLVNWPPGPTIVKGRKFLNTVKLQPVVYPTNAKGDPEKEFPFLWNYFENAFAPNEKALVHPKWHWFAWVKRSYLSNRYHKSQLGQAAFFCGSVNSGKSLIALHVLAPLLGDRYGNPTEYFNGITEFNDDLLEAPLLIIDDQAPSRNEAEKAKFAARLKSFTVNPAHTYHPKYCPRLEIEWIGRVFVCLNDDAVSVGVLPDVNEATRDKLMFFRISPYERIWPEDAGAEARREIPYLAYWLEYVCKPPPEVYSQDRMGVVSYFDPTILDLSRQQGFSYNALELIKTWVGSCWADSRIEGTNRLDWEGTPSDLLSALDLCEQLRILVRDWNASRMGKCLTTLARQAGSGVEFCSTTSHRRFRIVASKILQA